MLEHDQLIALTKSLDQVAYALHNFCVKTLEALGASPTVAAKTEPTPPAEQPTQPAEHALTLVDVRKVAAEKTRQGHTDAIRALLESYGVNKLSEVDPSAYASLMQKLEALGNE